MTRTVAELQARQVAALEHIAIHALRRDPDPTHWEWQESPNGTTLMHLTTGLAFARLAPPTFMFAGLA